MSIDFYLKLINDVFKIEQARIPNYNKRKFYSCILELLPIDVDKEDCVVEDVLNVMVALNYGNIESLIKTNEDYHKVNVCLQFSFIRKRIDVTLQGNKHHYNWSYYQERYIDKLEIKISTAAEMRMLVDALVLFWNQKE
ncbi:hypothetical protein [Aeromonas phage ZPAH34]|uniref:hypothetical protein n=1 Tax=Aeromonas phage ZPAH34 TaxID=2924888 RepID=UPI00232985B5|nr:hypothetical protein PQD16_gp165 [Aeromonas phage ZPAH34]UOX39518.1 hypothetical protein [Aeromonas phage ZPAH34]